MATYILFWNPDISSYTKERFLDDFDHRADVGNWSFHEYEKVKNLLRRHRGGGNCRSLVGRPRSLSGEANRGDTGLQLVWRAFRQAARGKGCQ